MKVLTCRSTLLPNRHPRVVIPHALQKDSTRTRVKICGLTDVEDARHALECGADLLGMIMWPKAKRYVPPLIARRITTLAQSFRMDGEEFPKVVGVFVDEDTDQIARIKDDTNIDLVQLHGDASRKALPFLDSEIGKIVVLHADMEGNIKTMEEGLPVPVDYVLVDGLKGGSGVRFPLKTLTLPDWITDTKTVRQGWFLAGGLDANNVASALHELHSRDLHPFGVDVSSGVCDESGLRKSHSKIMDFVSRAQS